MTLLTVILAAVSAFGPNVAATAPPVIITTKSSPLCTAVREIVAPTVAGLIFQDRIIDRGRGLMQAMASDGKAFELDNVHLGIDVYHLAANNIKIHQSLDQLDALKIPDARAAADLAQLHAKLQGVADGQAAMLNVMSGIAQSNDLGVIARVGNDVATAISAERGAIGNPPSEGASLAPLERPVQPRTVGGLITEYGQQIRASESALLPSLLPVISRCR
jgi:hypothetical protein